MKDNRHFISSLIERMPVAISYSNLEDAKLINCNEICLKLFGFSNKKEVIGRTVFELNVYDNAEQRMMVVNLLKEQKIIKNLELPMQTSQGIRVWVAASFQVLEIDNVLVLFAVMIDITKRKDAEEALEKLNKELEQKIIASTEELRKSEWGLKMAQEISRIGNWEVDLITDKSSWSDEIYRILGYEKGEVEPVLETYLSTFHPDDIEYCRTVINESMNELKGTSFIHRSYRKDGTIVHLYNESRFLFDEMGKPITVYGIIQDVTETVVREAKLMKQNTTLVDIATMQSHQVRKPVAQILGLLNLLKTDNLADPSNAEVLAKLKETTTAFDKIIRDISKMSEEITKIN
jgi:PAS domain S-box-containing protein